MLCRLRWTNLGRLVPADVATALSRCARLSRLGRLGWRLHLHSPLNATLHWATNPEELQGSLWSMQANNFSLLQSSQLKICKAACWQSVTASGAGCNIAVAGSKWGPTTSLTAPPQALAVGWAAGLKALFFLPATFQSSCTTTAIAIRCQTGGDLSMHSMRHQCCGTAQAGSTAKAPCAEAGQRK